jgi:hypothetical protein
MDDDYDLETSPLCRDLEDEGRMVRVWIYRSSDSDWLLEAVDEFGNSTVWEDQFPTDEAAFEEVRRAIRDEGIGVLIGEPSPGYSPESDSLAPTPAHLAEPQDSPEPLISAELMERTWLRVGAQRPEQIPRMQKVHAKAQKPLAAFVYSMEPDLDEDVAGVLFYVFHVVLEAFRQAEPRPKRVSRRRVEEQLSAIEFTGLPPSPTGEDFETSEPHVLRYVTEALSEEDDPLLTLEEFHSCLETLWVAIECLHAACRRR